LELESVSIHWIAIMAKLKHGTETTISMAFIVMCSEKVLRLLRLFFVLILGWLLGLYSLQDDGLRGLPLASAVNHTICCLRYRQHRVAGCFGEVPAFCRECPGFVFQEARLRPLPPLGSCAEDIEGS